ncbi:hypothetical protein GNX18_00675 [Microbulbifer sp. SH-1]|uniref:hypothetical protein n=1 Tax=Microbulbifer sp. SH-1 TaxID=2681547 RepID=UPI0014099DC7|nr:hypothetical protein [Microbulbifer sp. SH-1]QIL88447.1 hypothetical protein GNX18_00675 [Microbulbifer sp. SH-1]
MQLGLWGTRHRSDASVRANVLLRVSEPIQREMAGLVEGQSAPILRFLLHYNMKYRKTDILGGLTGGAFTNFASTGG